MPPFYVEPPGSAGARDSVVDDETACGDDDEDGERPTTLGNTASDQDDSDKLAETLSLPSAATSSLPVVRGPLPPPTLPPVRSVATMTGDDVDDRNGREGGDSGDVGALDSATPPNGVDADGPNGEPMTSTAPCGYSVPQHEAPRPPAEPDAILAPEDNPTRFAPIQAIALLQQAPPAYLNSPPELPVKVRVPGQRAALIAMSTLLVAALVFFAIRPQPQDVGAEAALMVTERVPTLPEPPLRPPPVAAAPDMAPLAMGGALPAGPLPGPAIATPTPAPQPATPRSAEPRRRPQVVRSTLRQAPIPIRREP